MIYNKEYKIENSRVDAYYDMLDRACMFLNEKIGLDYLSSFLRVYNDIKSSSINRSSLEEDDINVLEEYENNIASAYLLNEEIREALLLILIKAFKHADLSLDLMTPDYIGYLFTFIIKSLFMKEIKNEKKERISILDINLGTSNLINLISNNLDFDSVLSGIEVNELYAYISAAFSDLQGNEVSIFKNSCLDYMTLGADCIIADLDCVYENGKYLPYEAILKYQNVNLDRSFMIFLVDNDFFSKKEINEFKEKFKGTILALIALDESLFKGMGKSILIISPKRYKSVDTLALRLPREKETSKYKKALLDIKEWLKKF